MFTINEIFIFIFLGLLGIFSWIGIIYALFKIYFTLKAKYDKQKKIP